MERTEASNIGSTMPEFSLPGTDGKEYTQNYFDNAKACLVVFTCNHCPYVKGSEEKLIETVKKYQNDGLKVLTISANDAVQYPEDSFENMQKKAAEMNLPYPYLYDETQSIAKKFDAACTPECFLYNSEKQLAFHGAINNSPRNPENASENFIEQAIQQVIETGKATPAFINPIGCSVKWKN